MINAGLHAPDAVMLDLEDSVHADEKDAARLLVRDALRAVYFGRAERMVRINPLPTDLEEVRALAPHGAPDLPAGQDRIGRRRCGRCTRWSSPRLDGVVGGRIGLVPILESARGVEALGHRRRAAASWR